MTTKRTPVPHVGEIDHAFLPEFLGGAIEYDAPGVFFVGQNFADRYGAPPNGRNLIGVQFRGDLACALCFGNKRSEHALDGLDLDGRTVDKDDTVGLQTLSLSVFKLTLHGPAFVN